MGDGNNQVITNTEYTFQDIFQLQGTCSLLPSLDFTESHMKLKRGAALPPGSNINASSNIYNSHTSKFLTAMLSSKMSL